MASQGSSAGGSVIQLICNSYNNMRCKQFLDDTQKLITRWFEGYSLTFSIGDILPPDDIVDKMDVVKAEGIKEVDYWTEELTVVKF